MYKIKLENGIEIGNLELNGNNYISENIIESSIFEDNLGQISIFEEGAETACENMKLVQNKVNGTQSWFILAEKTKEEIEKETFGQGLSEREIQEMIQGVQLSGLEIRLIMGGL